MNLITVGATGIRQELLENSQIAAAVLDSVTGLYKIFLRAAPGEFNFPYITLTHIWGGDQNRDPQASFDMLWRVCAVNWQLSDAEDLSHLVLDQLIGSKPGFPDGWSAWTYVTSTGPYMEMRLLQNEEFWEVGAYLRLRGNKIS